MDAGVVPSNFSAQSIIMRSGWGTLKITWSRVALQWLSWGMEVMYVKVVPSFGIGFLTCLCVSICIVSGSYFMVYVWFRFEALKQSPYMIQALGSLSSTLHVNQLRSIGLEEQLMWEIVYCPFVLLSAWLRINMFVVISACNTHDSIFTAEYRWNQSRGPCFYSPDKRCKWQRLPKHPHSWLWS